MDRDRVEVLKAQYHSAIKSWKETGSYFWACYVSKPKWGFTVGGEEPPTDREWREHLEAVEVARRELLAEGHTQFLGEQSAKPANPTSESNKSGFNSTSAPEKEHLNP